MISLALALLTLAVVLLVWALRIRQRTGLPWAPVRSQDTRGRELEKPLVARRLGLTGKPDYVIERRGALIPVEVKPGRQSPVPYESDLMQLAAYCVLIEETEDTPPPYGLLRYAERTFQLDYTPQVRAEVLDLIDEMRAALDQADCQRSHDEARRCQSCGFFEVCEDAL
ncbi:MAG: CRISPR-associated protein Cas4 [Roseiflexaceae bacterium]|nr:CRISPR-associated protein Cas4 [Roseiflexaceae bacterium]